MATDRQGILEGLRQQACELPACPGVYLFKDSRDRVLYVGKAKNLRARVCSYFQPSADLAGSRGVEIDRMIRQLVTALDAIPCDSEVDALLRENRLIKDIQPRFNERLKDDKSFPYLQIVTREDFPRVEITRQPQGRGVRLYGPFVSPADLRAALPLLQRVFKFRTCKLEISDDDESRRFYRPCILHNIRQCTAPCAALVSREDYARQIAHLRAFVESKGSLLRKELTGLMKQASADLDFERAAGIRDELKALEGLQMRGLASEDTQPEVFYVDPAEGMVRLTEVLSSPTAIRTMEGIDIAHLAGGESVGAMVCFIDGKPFKGAYRRYRIRTSAGNDDLAAITEVVNRRYRHAAMNEELFPDVILIDGGKGQLSAAYHAFDNLQHRPPMLISLAKKQEELYILGCDQPVKLARNDPALRILQQVRDEAHRFAQHYHHILRRKATLGEGKAPKNPPPGRGTNRT